MDKDQVLEKVIACVAETMDLDGDTLDEDTSFESLEADSLDRIEMVTAMEDEFEITLDDSELESIETVGDAVDAIMRAL